MRRPIQTIAVACAFTVLALALALALAGAGAPVAMAAAGNAVINNCESNGQLTHQYTHQELAHALAVMPASVKQYTNCYDVIQQALVKGQGRTGTAGSSSSSSFLPTSVIVILEFERGGGSVTVVLRPAYAMVVVCSILLVELIGR